MTTDPARKWKDFDCVASMRRIRDTISSEIAGMSGEELARWFNSREYSDPIVRRLAGRVKAPASHNDDHPKRK